MKRKSRRKASLQAEEIPTVPQEETKVPEDRSVTLNPSAMSVVWILVKLWVIYRLV